MNPEQIRESRRRLLRLGFFKSVVFAEKVRDDLKDVEDIIITVIEQKKRTVILKPGVSTDDGARLGGSIGYTNIAGTGRSTLLSGRVNHQFDDEAIWEHRLVATYLEPWIFNYVNGKINLIQASEEQQFDITRPFDSRFGSIGVFMVSNHIAVGIGIPRSIQSRSNSDLVATGSNPRTIWIFGHHFGF